MESLKKKILIAEDNDDIRYIYKRMLKEGFEILEAVNGKEAVELYKKHRPDLTLMDIRMPVMNGEEAISKIMVFDKQANIVIISAFNYKHHRYDIPVIHKGFDKKFFLQTIAQYLDNPSPEKNLKE